MNNDRNLLVAVLAIGTFVQSAQAIDNFYANGVTWAHSYEGDVLPPASSPAWITNATFSGSSDGNVLTISSGYAQMPGGVGNANWDGSSVTGSTLEVRMRVTSQTGTFGGSFFIGNQLGYAGLGVSTNMVTVLGGGGNPTRSLDATQFHTYRITLSNDVVRFFFDNDTNYLGNFTISGGTYNALDFGYGSGAAAGSSQYDFVRWTNEGAFPVPEPGALGLAGAALLILARRSRKTAS